MSKKIFIYTLSLFFISACQIVNTKNNNISETQQVSESQQLILVTVKNWKTIYGTLQLYQRNKQNEWHSIGKHIQVIIGKKGSAWDQKIYRHYHFAGPVRKEGDYRTPMGLFPIEYSFGFSAKPITDKLPYIHVINSTVCIGDRSSKFYNKIVTLNSSIKKDWRDNKDMNEQMREIPVYKYGLVIGYNMRPVRVGDGGCVFMHIWRKDYRGTAGCTAMSEKNIKYIIRWLDQCKNPILVQLPLNKYKSLQKVWGLPLLH